MSAADNIEISGAKSLAEHARTLPFLARCGYALVRSEGGDAEACLTVTPLLAGLTGHLNGTELYGLLDCTAWFAIAPLLGPSEAAVTHDAHFSLLSTAPTGSEVRLTAHVDKRGRTTAFIRVQAHVGGRLFAAATVTKSIISTDARMRHAKAT